MPSELRANDTSDEALTGAPRNTTIRQLIKDEYGYGSLDDAAVAKDFDVLERVQILLAHRGYDDPITVQENEDGYDVVTHG